MKFPHLKTYLNTYEPEILTTPLPDHNIRKYEIRFTIIVKKILFYFFEKNNTHKKDVRNNIQNTNKYGHMKDRDFRRIQEKESTDLELRRGLYTSYKF